MEHVTTRIWAAALSVLLLLVSAGALALGLGSIEVNSTLNAPLRARIDLSSLQAGDLEGMQVQLASIEHFKRAGIQRPFQLSKLKFTAVENPSSGGHINITTRESVVEPFLNFLVEVTWPRGRIVREYTILLDPPVYGAAISSRAKKDLAEAQARALQPPPAPEPPPAPKRAEPAPAVSQAPPAPVVQPSISTVPAPARAPASTTMAAAPAPEPEPEPEPVAAPQPAPAQTMAPAPMPTGALPDAHDVIYGDTLWSLAKRYRSDNSVSIQRMMLAMLSANPDAFNIQNINALRAGTVLQIPDLSQFGAADRQVVLAEVNRQHEIWQEYRQGLAGAAPQAPEGASAAASESEPATSASGSSPEPAATQAETQAQAETEPAATDGDRLALVSGGQGTEGVGSASSETASAAQTQQELNLAREEADAKTRQADELNSRVADLEGIVEELQRAIQLRDDNIAALQEMLAKVELEASELRAAAEQAEAQAAAAGAGTETAPEPMVTPPPEPVVEAPPEPVVEAPPEPVVAVAPEPEPPKLLPPAPPPPSFIDSLLESLPVAVDPVLLGAGLGGLLVVLGGAALWRRRRTSEEAEDMGELDVGALDDSDLLYDEDGEPYLPDDVGDAAGISDLQDADLSGKQAEPQAQVEELDAPDSTGIAVSDSAAGSDDSEDDPLTEVNVYLAYERYDQAEELVRSAIGQYPDRHEYKLRLLEVFYAAKDLGNFESSARELQDAVGADNQLLSEARKMWQDMSPGRELFSEAESTVPEDQDVLFDVTGGDVDSPATVPGSSLGDTDDSSSVDFDLGFEAPATAEGDAGSGESSLDFDLGFDQAAGDGAQEESGLDLDLTSIGGDSEYVGADAGGGSGVDFDLGAGDAPAAEDDSGSSSMDFDLTGMDSSVGQSGGPSTETPLPERVSRDDDDMDFDLEGLGEGTLIDSQVPPEAPAGAVPEPLDTADADDGAMDFDLDGIGGESAGVESGAMSMDAEFTALDLNLDTADAGAASSGSQLSALDDANSALGFDIGGDSVDAGAGESPDEDLDFGLELDDDGPTAGGDFNLSLEDDLDDEVSEETVKLDLNAALGGDDLADELDTVKLQTPEIDAADSAISDLGMDLNLDMDESEGTESSAGVDTAFDGVFGDDAGAASDDDMALSLDGSDLIPSTPSPPADAEPDFPEIDLDFDAEKSQDAAASDEYESTQFMLRDMPTSDSASAGSGEGHSGSTLMLGGGLTGEVDEVQTKLDLAQAYIDMGDTDGAKGIIDEVLAEGNASQKQAAMGLLGKLASS